MQDEKVEIITVYDTFGGNAINVTYKRIPRLVSQLLKAWRADDPKVKEMITYLEGEK